MADAEAKGSKEHVSPVIIIPMKEEVKEMQKLYSFIFKIEGLDHDEKMFNIMSMTHSILQQLQQIYECDCELVTAQDMKTSISLTVAVKTRRGHWVVPLQRADFMVGTVEDVDVRIQDSTISRIQFLGYLLRDKHTQELFLAVVDMFSANGTRITLKGRPLARSNEQIRNHLFLRLDVPLTIHVGNHTTLVVQVSEKK